MIGTNFEQFGTIECTEPNKNGVASTSVKTAGNIKINLKSFSFSIS